MTGNDLRQIGVPITLDGKNYNLVIDLDALIDINDKFKDIDDDETRNGVDKGFELLRNFDYKAVKYFAYVAFRHDDETITEKQVAKLIGSSNFYAIAAKLIEAMIVSLPLPDDDAKNAETQAEK